MLKTNYAHHIHFSIFVLLFIFLVTNIYSKHIFTYKWIQSIYWSNEALLLVRFRWRVRLTELLGLVPLWL